jgi:hypothetical protein
MKYVTGSINGQRPIYTKPPPSSYITKKPTRPTTQNTIYTTTTKYPVNNKPGDFYTHKNPIKPINNGYTPTSSSPPQTTTSLRPSSTEIPNPNFGMINSQPPSSSEIPKPNFGAVTSVIPQYTVISTHLPPKPTERPAILDFVTPPPRPTTLVHLIKPNQHPSTTMSTVSRPPPTTIATRPSTSTVVYQTSSTNTKPAVLNQDPGIIQGRKGKKTKIHFFFFAFCH